MLEQRCWLLAVIGRACGAEQKLTLPLRSENLL